MNERKPENHFYAFQDSPLKYGNPYKPEPSEPRPTTHSEIPTEPDVDMIRQQISRLFESSDYQMSTTVAAPSDHLVEFTKKIQNRGKSKQYGQHTEAASSVEQLNGANKTIGIEGKKTVRQRNVLLTRFEEESEKSNSVTWGPRSETKCPRLDETDFPPLR